YLQIIWDDGASDKYLIIGHIDGGYFDYFTLYNENDKPFFRHGLVVSMDNSEYSFFPRVFPPERISATSALREGNIIYSTDNLDRRLDICWAVRGGVGEKIIIQTHYEIAEICISIGFISFTRPHLYRQNSRPKKLRISYEGEAPKIVELADTYHLQSLRTSSYHGNGKKIWIEILEVYPGTRFNDTCINFFMYDTGQ
ncbi:MAG: hypothetical protein LBI06_07610, partial [Treponema sp.]|nr:hypothetical protein [Treponema sp.]